MTGDAALDDYDDYGDDHCIYRDGQFWKTGETRTIRPQPGETNGAFVARMARRAKRTAQLGGRDIDVYFERHDGAVVACEISYEHDPQPLQLLMDQRPAGGRFTGARGKRSRQRAA